MLSPPVNVDELARDIASSIRQLLEQASPGDEVFRLECSLLSSRPGSQRLRVASIDVATVVGHAPKSGNGPSDVRSYTEDRLSEPRSSTSSTKETLLSLPSPIADDDARPTKRRAIGGLRVSATSDSAGNKPSTTPRRLESDVRVFPQRKKRNPETPSFQPSTISKFINGIWESIFSGNRLDPVEVIEQWQAIESGGQPRLLTDTQSGLDVRNDSLILETFGKMTVLARKITQTSKVCRSLEVIVQAHWIDAFDGRVAELSTTTTKEKAKKIALSEACKNFDWSDKEIRNRMAIWRGYAEIKQAGGWAALVFAGMGLYRLAKYRVSFTEETFATLRALRHRFEVSEKKRHGIESRSAEAHYTPILRKWQNLADAGTTVALPRSVTQDNDTSLDILRTSLTLLLAFSRSLPILCILHGGHSWPLLMNRLSVLTLAIHTTVSQSGMRVQLPLSMLIFFFTGVVCGPKNEALPLASTYHKWDTNFSYRHLEESTIDEEAWGLFDPRTVTSTNACVACGEHQSDDPQSNQCVCFPNLYGGSRTPSFVPVQVYQTPNGKNNGLLACGAFDRGASIGEFVGEITSGRSEAKVISNCRYLVC